MKISFIKPNYPNESRVSILPKDIKKLINAGAEVIIESGFGEALDIIDEEYIREGAVIATRAECYEEKYIFNLKLTQPSDYEYLRADHVLIGWTHPFGSGAQFYNDIVVNVGLTLIDIDSVTPRLLKGREVQEIIDLFPPHMFWRNSYNAGIASVRLARKQQSFTFSPEASICVLGSGSVAQGAFHELSRMGAKPRMFYRKTLPIFRSIISEFDIIVNGIEVDTPGYYIMDRNDVMKTKENVFIIEAAADAGNAIQGTEYQSFESPVSEVYGRKYLLVNNAPSAMTLEASRDISCVVASSVIPGLIENCEKIKI